MDNLPSLILLAPFLFIVSLELWRRRQLRRYTLSPEPSSAQSPDVRYLTFEEQIAETLTQLPEEYLVINDVLFEGKSGSTQIDHIVVSPYAVFVIETKGISASQVFTSENNDYWRVTETRGSRRNYNQSPKIYNPIKQNEGHINALKYHLYRINKIQYVSIVVFDDGVDLLGDIRSSWVLNHHELLDVITSYQDPKLQLNQVHLIKRIIDDENNTTIEAQYRHIDYAKQRRQTYHNTLAEGNCPQCMGKLVLCQGKYSFFVGCSSYPKCKYCISLMDLSKVKPQQRSVV